MAKDPVCGMEVDERKAAAMTAYRDKTYYFCTQACKRVFDKDPEKYTASKILLVALTHRHGFSKLKGV